jgi:hypothetical protein
MKLLPLDFPPPIWRELFLVLKRIEKARRDYVYEALEFLEAQETLPRSSPSSDTITSGGRGNSSASPPRAWGERDRILVVQRHQREEEEEEEDQTKGEKIPFLSKECLRSLVLELNWVQILRELPVLC